LRICQTKKYLLFKRLNEDRKKQIESVNSVVEELNNKISNILNSSTNDKITTIDIDEMIKKQEKEPDIKDRLETIKKIKMD
jgi:regulator of sigma D